MFYYPLYFVESFSVPHLFCIRKELTGSVCRLNTLPCSPRAVNDANDVCFSCYSLLYFLLSISVFSTLLLLKDYESQNNNATSEHEEEEDQAHSPRRIKLKKKSERERNSSQKTSSSARSRSPLEREPVTVTGDEKSTEKKTRKKKKGKVKKPALTPSWIESSEGSSSEDTDVTNREDLSAPAETPPNPRPESPRTSSGDDTSSSDDTGESCYWNGKNKNLVISWINPIALRMAKTLWSFDCSECNRVKVLSAMNLFYVQVLHCNLK